MRLAAPVRLLESPNDVSTSVVAAAEFIKVHEEKEVEEEEDGHEKVDVKETIPNAESGPRLRCGILSRMDLEQTCRPHS